MILTKYISENIKENWSGLLNEFNKPYWNYIEKCIDSDIKQGKTVLPKKEYILNALLYTPLNNVKVVILDHEPYNTKYDAHGLSFSSNSPLTPKTLQNIFGEIKYSYPNTIFNDNNLISWTKQGVLLLNKILSVVEGVPLSHENIGWEIFTKKIMKLINSQDRVIIWLLLGDKAINNKQFITNSKHIVFKTSHPNPLSTWKKNKLYDEFNGSKVFEKINQILKNNNLSEINWGT